MSRRNQKNQKRNPEHVVKATPVKFELTPVRNGHDVELLAEVAIEVKQGERVEQLLVPVRRGTPQFNPRQGKQYLCDVKLRCNASGAWNGRATPCKDVVPLLDNEEWNTDLRDALTVRLTFRKGRNDAGRPIAFFDGSPVFPARGSEVVLRQSRKYLLVQKDGFAYGAILLDQASGNRRERDDETIEVRIPVAKSPSPQSEDDLDYRVERKSIGDLLGISGEGATPDSVRAAAAAKIKALRLDKPKPFVLKRMTECFAEAIQEAESKALEILGAEADPASEEREELSVGITDEELAQAGAEDEPEQELDTLVAE